MESICMCNRLHSQDWTTICLGLKEKLKIN